MSLALQPSVDALATLKAPSLFSIVDDVFALYARQIITQSIEEGKGRLPVGREPISWNPLKSRAIPVAPVEPVGILGAGMFDRSMGVLSVTDDVYAQVLPDCTRPSSC